MTKFTFEHKIDANPEVVRMWIKQFEYHGLAAFVKPYTSHTMQFKKDVLNYMSENEASTNEAVVLFNISSPALIRK